MVSKKEGLDILCNVYEKLSETDKEILIRLAEGLSNSQKIIEKEKVKLKEENQNTELN